MQKVFLYIYKVANPYTRFLLTFLIYVFFWGLFYGSYIALPTEIIAYLSERFGIIMSFYLFGIVPIISFVLPRAMVRYLGIKAWLAYSLHIIALFLFLVAFYTLALYKAYNSIGADYFLS